MAGLYLAAHWAPRAVTTKLFPADPLSGLLQGTGALGQHWALVLSESHVVPLVPVIPHLVLLAFPEDGCDSCLFLVVRDF